MHGRLHNRNKLASLGLAIITLVGGAFTLLANPSVIAATPPTSISGNKAEAVFQKGKIALDRRDYRQAYVHFQRAAQLNSDNTQYLQCYRAGSIFHPSAISATTTGKGFQSMMITEASGLFRRFESPFIRFSNHRPMKHWDSFGSSVITR